ncbi:MAG TPA: sigma-70 family RNA polymerase sigma factor [Verrucomicrobiales bacterium]|nr:sigma-70 family RNA polymerase sigma factor [Verrucomicrobiales bacterium]
MLENNIAVEREKIVHRALIEFESALIGYAASIVKDEDRAKDVVQDTFIKLYEQDPEKVKESLKAWLFTVCRNRALDILRKEKRMVALVDEKADRLEGTTATPDRVADWDERVTQVMNALDRLSDNQRKVIRLKFQQELSYKEISEATGLAPGNVGFLLHTGLKRLRALLPEDLLENSLRKQ